MSSFGRMMAVAGGISLMLALVVAPRAQAAPVACGQVVTASTTLDADLVCPNGDGLVIQGNGITLNLNGRTIRGRLESRSVTQFGAIGDNGQLGAPYTVRYATGQYTGIRVRGSGNTVVGPGAVKHFAAGIVVEGGSGNTVRRLTVEQNFGPPGTTDLGDGIMILDSTDNRVIANTVRDNGPFDGIVMLGGSGRNTVQGNVVVDNRQPEICPTYDFYRFSTSGGGFVHVCGPTHPVVKPFMFTNQQNHGVKFEGLGPNAPYENLVTTNTINRNGNTGVFVPSTCPDFGPGAGCEGARLRDNVITANQVNRNGYGYPTGSQAATVFEGPNNGGSGIALMMGGPNPPIHQVIRGNTVNENARHGITILNHRPGSTTTASVIEGNTALRNNGLPEGGASYNAMDGNAFVNPSAPCDANVWRDNNFGSSPADINGPVPPNNLTNHPCVGPVLS